MVNRFVLTRAPSPLKERGIKGVRLINNPFPLPRGRARRSKEPLSKVGIIALTLILAMAVGLSACAAPSPLKAPLPSWRGELHPLQIVITGCGDNTSPPFTVTTEEWCIDWSYVPNPEYPDAAIFGFFVYPRGKTAVYVESVLFPEGTSGSIYSYAGAGEYYIKVTAGNVEVWEVVISPLQ